MKKQKILCLVTLVCYFIFVVAGASIAIGAAADLANLPKESGGVGAALSAFGLALVLILGGIYAAVGIVPLILKSLHILTKKRFFAYICVVFDVVFSIAHAGLMVSAIAESGFAEPLSILVPAALLVLSFGALVTNILSAKKPKEQAA